jgi:hypothetical protein
MSSSGARDCLVELGKGAEVILPAKHASQIGSGSSFDETTRPCQMVFLPHHMIVGGPLIVPTPCRPRLAGECQRGMRVNHVYNLDGSTVTIQLYIPRPDSSVVRASP